MDFEDYLRQKDIYIHLLSLPTRIRGFAYYSCSHYDVYINTRLCSEQRRKTAIHELIHILENHFDCPIHCKEECESRTKAILNDLKTFDTYALSEYI